MPYKRSCSFIRSADVSRQKFHILKTVTVAHRIPLLFKNSYVTFAVVAVPN